MDKKWIVGLVIILLILFAIYMYLGSATPENVTQPTNMVKSNVSGISI